MIPWNISDVEKPLPATETGDERLGLFLQHAQAHHQRS
jgi:hypothetical protein